MPAWPASGHCLVSSEIGLRLKGENAGNKACFGKDPKTQGLAYAGWQGTFENKISRANLQA